MTTKHVYLGRFSPFHLGHTRLLSKVIALTGVENCLVMIGSSDSINSRTPYTYEQREEIIKAIFPKIEIIPLPDANSNLEFYDGTTNDVWLDSIEKIAKLRDEKYIFYGGSKRDLEILAKRFETIVLIDRLANTKDISATTIRKLLAKGDLGSLKQLVDSKAIDLIIKYFKAI